MKQYYTTNKTIKKISLISPLFQYLHYRPQFGCYQSKKDEVLLPKKLQNFCQRRQKLRQEMFFYQQEKKKMENRERNKSCNSIWLEAKACFWSLLKIFLFVLAPLLTRSSITLQCGRKRKSFVTHRWFKISLIELLDPEEGTTWCTQWSAETFAQKMLSVSPPNVPVKVLLFFNERKTPSLVLNVTKVYFLQSQLQFPWNKSRNYQGSARASFYQNPTGEDKKDILATLPPAAAGFYFFLLSRIIWTQKELFGKYRQPFW